MGGYEESLSGGNQSALCLLLCGVSSRRERSGVTAGPDPERSKRTDTLGSYVVFTL